MPKAPAAVEVETQTPEEVQEEGDPLALYDDNSNGGFTCAEARKHGIAPMHSDHPAYAFVRDRDGDGVVCASEGGEGCFMVSPNRWTTEWEKVMCI